MNTSTEWGEKPPETDFENIVPGKINENAASLAEQLTYERDARKEERFFWIFGVVLLFDVSVCPEKC